MLSFAFKKLLSTQPTSHIVSGLKPLGKYKGTHIINLESSPFSAVDLGKISAELKEDTAATIGRIRWHVNQPRHEPFFKQIEQLLEEHQRSFLDRPSPYVYAILSQQVYKNDATLMQLPDGWAIHRVSGDTSDQQGYFGAAYLNKKMKHMIIAHRGTEPSQFRELLKDFKQDMMGIIQNRVTLHEANAVIFAQDIVREALGVGYQVSFTGHSLGGWLAQVCTYQLVKQKYGAYAVVFDSPGVYQKLQNYESGISSSEQIDLTRLDITTFLSAPNLVNTCNDHLGTVYRLYPELPIFSFYKPYEYLLETHSKERLVGCFSRDTGAPIKHSLIIKWPKIDWSQAKPNSNLFSACVGALIDIVNGKKIQYDGVHAFANAENQFDPAQEKNLSEQDKYFVHNAYRYQLRTEVNLQEIDCRHLSQEVFDFLLNYQNNRHFLESLEEFSVIKNLNIYPVLKKFLNYEIKSYPQGGYILKLLENSELKNVLIYRQKITALITYYDELKYLDYKNHLKTLLNTPKDLFRLTEDLSQQRENNVQLLQKLSGLQVQARLYLYGDPTEEERTEVNQQENQIAARLDANAQLVGKIDKKISESVGENKQALLNFKEELKIQEQQLRIAELMNKALKFHRLHRYKEGLECVEKILFAIENYGELEKSNIFSSIFSESSLRGSLYNLQAKLYRILLPKEEWKKVEESYTLAIKYNSQDATLHSSKGAFLNDWGKHEEAIVFHRQAETLDRYRPIVLSNLAWGVYQLSKMRGDLVKCVPEISLKYQESLKKAPYLSGTWYYQALLKRDQGDISGALEDFKKALEIQPGHPKVLYYRSQLYFDQGEWGNAIKDLETAKTNLGLDVPEHQEQLKAIKLLIEKIEENKSFRAKL